MRASSPELRHYSRWRDCETECLDWTGGQIKNDDSADNVLNIDLSKIHYLSGPFEIAGAEPGDVLHVEIQDGVKFAGLIHPGILGCAPSAEILEEWNRREGELSANSTLSRIVANPHLEVNSHAESADESVAMKVGVEGARTIPGRPEHGGNCDIKNLSRGSKVNLPVHVPGAKFSVGDLHFSRKIPDFWVITDHKLICL